MVQGGEIEWQTQPLGKLEQVMQESKDAGKYLFIHDKQGSVGTFMNYKGHLCDLGPAIVKIGLGRGTAQEVGEIVRKGFVAAMRNGDRLCIDIQKVVPQWSTYNSDGTFDHEKFFNYATFAQEAEYMRFVREDENHGIGGVNPGFGYTRSPNFVGMIRSDCTDEDLPNVLASIPNIQENFMCVVIQ